MKRLAVPIGLCVSLAAIPVSASPFRFDELARTKRVESFSVSPDGRWIAFSLATADLDANRMRSAIWLVSSSSGESRSLTSGQMRDSDPKFAPDGKSLAFLSDRDGGSQVWVLDLAGGEPRQATSFPTAVNDYKWSPDGKWFAVTADVFPDCRDVLCLEKRVAERRQAKTEARVAERLLFRHWNEWKDGMRSHIWKVPAAVSAESADRKQRR
jgi:dipeptidyl aminopeptidase/acylaminoacyl peptidase